MQTVIDILAFNTISRHTNLELIEYIASYLTGFSVVSRRIYSEDGQRANLFATIGATDRGGICFSGHSDVVPVDDQPWSSDPFILQESAGRF